MREISDKLLPLKTLTSPIHTVVTNKTTAYDVSI